METINRSEFCTQNIEILENWKQSQADEYWDTFLCTQYFVSKLFLKITVATNRDLNYMRF